MRLCRMPLRVIRYRRLTSRRTVGIETPSRMAASLKLTVAGGALGAGFVDGVLIPLNYGRVFGTPAFYISPYTILLEIDGKETFTG